ncbi:hypothetical protein V6N13_046898 [Hibiscus sabdariffa]|uniref:Disease resistance R13L4/SHOC-2-like LRR domain-containing protein n=1 Tax=Hibiscus sabdariffa TaxID=183260 RepID=A0ABR2ASQ5_9ROSI
MSSPNPKHQSSSPEIDPPPLTIHEIVTRLDNLHKKLSHAKYEPEKPSKLDPQQDEKDGDSKSTTNKPNPLDKACNELKYLKSAFEKLKIFETDLSKPLDTLEDNVKDILNDLDLKGYAKELIERNLNVLRANITKVKAQIPLQHQASSISESRYLQTTNTSKDVRTLLDPYRADGIFESKTFLKEFEDHYSDLDVRHKLCLLCFAIFPENAVVKKRLLRFWWEGEKLLSETKEEKKEKEKLMSEIKEKWSVNKILEKFVEKGFVEPVTKRSRSQFTSYKMHPIIRCLVIRLAQKAKFFHFDPKGYPDQNFFKSKKLCLVKSEGYSWWSKDVPPTAEEGENQKQEPEKEKEKQKQKPEKEKEKENEEKEKEKQKHKPENEKKEKEKEKKENDTVKREKERVKYLENLQTLFNVSKQFPDLREELFSKMKNIGVLYLGRWEPTTQRHMEVEKTEFLEGLEKMGRLLFFSLQGISGISKLPKSLGKLYNLRILDLRACHNLEELPKEVGSLKKLTHLDLSECYLLEKIPKDLSNLSNLKVLKGFVISKNSKCTLKHLTKLSNLVKLSINVNRKDFSINAHETETHFFKFTMLRKLKIAWGAVAEEDEDEETGQTSKTQESQAQKSSARIRKAIGKLKNIRPWGGVHGEGSSKSVPESKVADSTAKSGEVDDNRDAKKQASVATASKDADNKNENHQMKLEKLDLQCYPERELPTWLVPKNLKSLERLYIKGGELSNLGEIHKQWNVKILRLKYLLDIKINWKELQLQFPELQYLEKVNCPQIAFCPCDASGVWVSKQPPTN